MGEEWRAEVKRIEHPLGAYWGAERVPGFGKSPGRRDTQGTGHSLPR